MKMNTRSEIVKLVSELLKVGSENLKDETVATDVPGWDSLSHAEILLMIEDKFQINFELNDLVTISRFGDLINCVNEKMKC